MPVMRGTLSRRVNCCLTCGPLVGDRLLLRLSRLVVPVRSSISVSFRADIGGVLWQSSGIRARAGAATVVAATVVAATEHAKEGGQCCQAPGKQINDLPADGQRKARDRMDQEAWALLGEG